MTRSVQVSAHEPEWLEVRPRQNWLCPCGCGSNGFCGPHRGFLAVMREELDGVQARKRRVQPLKTHCKRGHPRTPDNVDPDNRCRICRQARRKVLAA